MPGTHDITVFFPRSKGLVTVPELLALETETLRPGWCWLVGREFRARFGVSACAPRRLQRGAPAPGAALGAPARRWLGAGLSSSCPSHISRCFRQQPWSSFRFRSFGPPFLQLLFPPTGQTSQREGPRGYSQMPHKMPPFTSSNMTCFQYQDFIGSPLDVLEAQGSRSKGWVRAHEGECASRCEGVFSLFLLTWFTLC